MALTFSDDKFEAEVLQSDIPVLVDFWAPWCGPCQAIGPIVEELATEYEGKCKIGKMNVDDNPQTGQKYGIMSIPTLLIFKGGEMVEQMTGSQGKDALAEAIEKHL